MAVQVAGPALFRRPGCSDPPSLAVVDSTAGKNEPKHRGLRNKREDGHNSLEETRKEKRARREGEKKTKEEETLLA